MAVPIPERPISTTGTGLAVRIESIADAAYRRIPDDYVTKPFSPREPTARFEAEDSVRLARSRRQDDDREIEIVFAGPELPADFESLYIRQHQVEHHEIGRALLDLSQSLSVVAGLPNPDPSCARLKQISS
jgi:hypothetical protein